jgi:hypothetical protein
MKYYFAEKKIWARARPAAGIAPEELTESLVAVERRAVTAERRAAAAEVFGRSCARRSDGRAAAAAVESAQGRKIRVSSGGGGGGDGTHERDGGGGQLAGIVLAGTQSP